MTRDQAIRKTTIQKRDNYIHIETDLGIINIWPGLWNNDGDQVTSISVVPDTGVIFDDKTMRFIKKCEGGRE